MTHIVIKAKNLKEAFRKARATYRGNLVVSDVKSKSGEKEYIVTIKMRTRHPK